MQQREVKLGKDWEEYDEELQEYSTEKLDGFLEDKVSTHSLWDHEALKGFYSFCEKQITEMRALKNKIRNINAVTFSELNTALYDHGEYYRSLVLLYNTAKIEEEALKGEFQIWFDEKYVVVRARENDKKLSAQKWLSAKELEAIVRVENSAQYKEYRIKIIAAERQTSFLRRLMDNFEGLKFALSTISRNQQTIYKSPDNY